MAPVHSISKRVARIAIIGVGTGITLSVGLFLIQDFRQAIKLETARYQSAAYAFAAASSDAVAKSDTRAALEVLRGVKNLPDVNYIAALDQNAHPFAEIGSGSHLIGPDGEMVDFWSASIRVEATVKASGITVGTIVMQAANDELLWRYLKALLSAGCVALFLVIVVAWFAKRQITSVMRPLSSLADQFHDIGNQPDLSTRIVKERDDEVGILIDAFNDMFGRIDERDQLLARHRESLEQTVEERTAQLRLAKEDAEAANAAKSDFLATMSHEIRTPMNGMLVMAEMLAAAPLAPRHLRFAEIITRSGKNLLHIINDILDLSKVEAGKIDLEQVAYSLDDVIEDVLCLFAERAREVNLTLAVVVERSVPRRIYGDPTRMSQILSNLVNNALKFTERGGVSVVVHGPDPQGMLEISVTDTGIGMTPDQVTRVFDRFQQADASIARRFGGTGLGLSITRQLVGLMGGRISVCSEQGSGSTFTVSLPCERADDAGVVGLENRRIVRIVDEDRLSRAATERALIDRGFEIAGDPTIRPDFLLLKAGQDYTFETCDCPVILLRGFAGTGATVPSHVEVVHELALPLHRQNLDRLCSAINQNDIASLKAAATDVSSGHVVSDFSRLRVLAVDDVAVNREVLFEALKSFGITCDLAASGTEGLERARSCHYDVIFMDCSMPDIDGFQVTNEIRAYEKTTQRPASFIVALTGHTGGREGERWRSEGMDAHIAKPFNIRQLLAILEGIPSENGISEKHDDHSGSPSEPVLSPASLAMFDEILEMTGTDLRKKVFPLFIQQAPTFFEKVRAAIDSTDTEAASLVHAMKSNCSSAGAQRAMILCETLETALKNGQLCSPLLVFELGQAVSDAVVMMEAQLQRAAKSSAA
ncbi:hypothetical protein DEM27_32080 [Metarhizobium album]|uniref:histidine kinase n=1 Tax=Metarhizobium album TaxID=2182425 RepID=A0A2U2DG54_9HYPH|nr:ATP-binding protein [Rhizobium album]PWE52221.1 hypothetical protein DEM27_32080 [Rhizobium album]